MYVNPLSATREYDHEIMDRIAETWWAGLVGGVVSVMFGAVILIGIGRSTAWPSWSGFYSLRGLAIAASRPSDGSVRTVNVVVGALETPPGSRSPCGPRWALTLAVLIGLRFLVGGPAVAVGAIATGSCRGGG